MTKAVPVLCSKRPNDIIRKPQFHGELVETHQSSLDGVSARESFLCPVGLELALTGVGEAKHAD
jgi:hypothetical protein